MAQGVDGDDTMTMVTVTYTVTVTVISTVPWCHHSLGSLEIVLYLDVVLEYLEQVEYSTSLCRYSLGSRVDKLLPTCKATHLQSKQYHRPVL